MPTPDQQQNILYTFPPDMRPIPRFIADELKAIYPDIKWLGGDHVEDIWYPAKHLLIQWRNDRPYLLYGTMDNPNHLETIREENDAVIRPFPLSFNPHIGDI